MRKNYDFDWFTVKWLPRYGWVLDRSPAVVILPIAPDDRVWLASIDRVPTRTRSWELPGGGVDLGEDPLEAGLRELSEECGLVARGGARLLPAALELAPGMGRFPHRIVIARDVVPAGRRPRAQREEGIVAVRSFDRAEVQKLVGRGRITVGATLAAFTLAGWLLGAPERRPAPSRGRARIPRPGARPLPRAAR